jgi:hypothetical protein
MWPPVPVTPRPTFDGFSGWVTSFMGIPTKALPPAPPPYEDNWLWYAYNTAVATVNALLMCVPGPQYLLAVYNLAGDLLVQWCPDQPGVLYPNPPNETGLGYFAYLRQQYGTNSFVAGVINASSDVSTSQALTVPKTFEALTIDQLQNLKTPWGRTYLGIASKVGSNWGIS